MGGPQKGEVACGGSPILGDPGEVSRDDRMFVVKVSEVYCKIETSPWTLKVVYHLPQIPGNSGWDVNGKQFCGSSHWKIPGTNGNSEKVVPFSRLGRSEWKFVYHLQVS